MNCRICFKIVNGKQKYQAYHDSCLRTLFGTVKLVPDLPFARNDFFTNLARLYTKRVSISGVQPKLPLVLKENKLAPTDSDFTHILKPSPESYPYAAENEHLCLRISRLVGIQTAECGLVSFPSGELAFCVKRFDYVSANQKIHQEDMMQAMGVHPLIVENAKYESKSYEDVALFLKEKSSIVIVKELFERIFFNFMVSNNDYHLKNIAIHFDNNAPGSIRLTPHFDVVNTGVYGVQDSELAMRLVNTKDGYTESFNQFGFHTKTCFDNFGERVGLNKKVRESIYSKYLDRYPEVLELVEQSFLNKQLKSLFNKELADRRMKFLKSSTNAI